MIKFMKLYPFQEELSKWLSDHPNTGNFSDVGTGKTATAIDVMFHVEASVMLVIAPKSVIPQWANEFERFDPHVSVHLSSGTKIDRSVTIEKFKMDSKPRKVLLMSYESARIEIKKLTPIAFDVVWLDEIHRIKNVRSRTHKALSELKSTYRYGSTATPFRNNALDIYGIFSWLRPGLLGHNYWFYQQDYCVKNSNGWIMGFRNLDKLAAKIRPHYIMRTLEEVGYQLPPLIEEDIVFDLSVKEAHLYERMRKEMLLEIEKEEISKIASPSSLYIGAVKVGKLQEVCDSLALVGDGEESSKLATLREHLSDVLGE